MLDHYLLVQAEFNGSLVQIVDKRSGSTTQLNSPNGRQIASIVPVKDSALVCLKGEGRPIDRISTLLVDKTGTGQYRSGVPTEILNEIASPFVLDGHPYQTLNRNSKMVFIGDFDINYARYPLANFTTDIWMMPPSWNAFITRSYAEEYQREIPFERGMHTLSLWSNGGLGRQYWSHSTYVGDGNMLLLGGADIVVWRDKVWTSGGKVYRVPKEPDEPFIEEKQLNDVFVVKDTLYGKSDKGQLFKYDGKRFVRIGSFPAVPKGNEVIYYDTLTSAGIVRWIRTSSNGIFNAELQFYAL